MCMAIEYYHKKSISQNRETTHALDRIAHDTLITYQRYNEEY